MKRGVLSREADLGFCMGSRDCLHTVERRGSLVEGGGCSCVSSEPELGLPGRVLGATLVFPAFGLHPVYFLVVRVLGDPRGGASVHPGALLSSCGCRLVG